MTTEPAERPEPTIADRVRTTPVWRNLAHPIEFTGDDPLPNYCHADDQALPAGDTMCKHNRALADLVDATLDQVTVAAQEPIATLTEAIRLTAEYVGYDRLPAVEGWSWYDALRTYAPDVADRMVAEAARTAQARQEAALCACSRPDWADLDYRHQRDGGCALWERLEAAAAPDQTPQPDVVEGTIPVADFPIGPEPGPASDPAPEPLPAPEEP